MGTVLVGALGLCPLGLRAASLGRQHKRKGLLAAMDSPSLDTGEGWRQQPAGGGGLPGECLIILPS